MGSGLLQVLPKSPAGKNGWVWTEESKPFPEKTPDGRPWPKISIVTPSFNQGQFLEETIRSVLLQNYPNLEYIIIDGGSTDNSVEIIKKYEPWLSYWISEKDKGHGHAINKGFARSTGEIMAWINSDDFYEPGIFPEIVEELSPEKGRYIVCGDCKMVFEDSNEVITHKPLLPNLYTMIFHFRLHKMRGLVTIPPQASVFWHRKVFETVGPVREDLPMSLDYEYWLRILKNGFKFSYISKMMSNYRFHSSSLSNQGWETFYDSWKLSANQYYQELRLQEKIFAEIYYWFFLVPASILTMPFRKLSYLTKKQIGRI